MKLITFLLSYIFLMIPTYFIRLAGASAAVQSQGDISSDGMAITINIILFLLLLGMVLITFYRGKRINKKWIVCFPIIALVFDVFIVFIPAIPTIMHILAIVFGCIEKETNTITNTENI